MSPICAGFDKSSRWRLLSHSQSTEILPALFPTVYRTLEELNDSHQRKTRSAETNYM